MRNHGPVSKAWKALDPVADAAGRAGEDPDNLLLEQRMEWLEHLVERRQMSLLGRQDEIDSIRQGHPPAIVGLQRIMDRDRHEIGERRGPGAGREGRLQRVRVGEIAPLNRLHIDGSNLEITATVPVEESPEHRRVIKGWQAEPAEGSSLRHQRARVHGADDRVIGDRRVRSTFVHTDGRPFAAIRGRCFGAMARAAALIRYGVCVPLFSVATSRRIATGRGRIHV